MRQYPSRPLVGIGIILLRGEEVLLIERANPPARGQWSLPGGAQELGETAVAAARRELREETGLGCGELRLIAHVDSIHRDSTGRIEYHYTILDFAAVYAGGIAAAGGDVCGLAWVHPRDFDDYALWPEARRVIALAQGRPHVTAPD